MKLYSSIILLALASTPALACGPSDPYCTNYNRIQGQLYAQQAQQQMQQWQNQTQDWLRQNEQRQMHNQLLNQGWSYGGPNRPVGSPYRGW